MQCDAVVASSGGGVCHDPPDTQVDRDPSRQPAPCARGTDSPKRPTGKGAGVQAGSRRGAGVSAVSSVTAVSTVTVERRQVPALERLVQGLWNVGQTRED